MPYKVTGVGGWGFSVSWEKVQGDEDVARRVVTFLEDRRMLSGKQPFEDVPHSVYSANATRTFLTEELTKAKPGKSLAQSLRAIRAAMRAFVDAAGPNARNFRRHELTEPEPDRFSLELGKLRSLVGLHLALIAGHYGIEIEDGLAQILPPAVTEHDDLSFIPGFD